MSLLIELKLENFVFNGLEVPSSVQAGGVQALAIQKIIGGKRVISSLGTNDNNIAWSALFMGVDAKERANYLDTLQRAGKPVMLTFSTYRFNVFIQNFSFKILSYNRLPYQISLAVIEDLTKPITTVLPPGFNDEIELKLQQAEELAELIVDPSVSSAIELLAIGITSAGDLGNATTGVIEGVLSQVSAASVQVDSLITSLGGA